LCRNNGHRCFSTHNFIIPKLNTLGVDPETVVKAVFSATKDELSEERVKEIAGFLPDKIRQLWEEA
jgi:uncharacterized protein (DUF2267 family)